MRAFSLVLAALLVLAPAASLAADPAPVIAAERAFAADGLALGIKGSFLKHMADDAIIFAPGPVSAKAFYAARPDRKGPDLVWWPLWAGMAKSGDLGFTTGPFTINGKPAGYYFTVWARQADGSWKWVYDGGTDSLATNAPPAATKPDALPPATGKGLYPEHALEELKSAEAKLAAGAKTDLKSAYAAVLVPEARVQGSPAAPATTPAAPATTPAAVATELATRAPQITFSPLGAATSKAGDLAWTYGEARWTKAGAPSSGHYVRIWRHDRPGWRLVFDQILDDPPGKS